MYARRIFITTAVAPELLHNTSIRHKYVLYSLCMSFVYANKGLGQHQHLNITFIYTLPTLSISNLLIADFDNPQVAGANNPSTFRYYHSEYMLGICPQEAYIDRNIQA